MENAVAYIKTVNIDSPADPSLPMFEIPYKKNTLTSMAVVPDDAADGKGGLNFDNDVWWPLFSTVLKEPKYFSWVRDNAAYSVETRVNSL